MTAVIEYFQLACAYCRIVSYSICRRLCCCKDPAPPRPEFAPVCIGLTGAGKTTLLSLLAGENTDNIEPTTGFLIKAVQFKRCILSVKEIGGGEKIRPFWKHYYGGARAVIFVLDSAASDELLSTAEDALHDALSNPQLRGLPCLILANCQDKPAARDAEQIREAMRLEEACIGRDWVLHTSSKNDIDDVREGFDKLISYLIVPEQDTQDRNHI